MKASPCNVGAARRAIQMPTDTMTAYASVPPKSEPIRKVLRDEAAQKDLVVGRYELNGARAKSVGPERLTIPWGSRESNAKKTRSIQEVAPGRRHPSHAGRRLNAPFARTQRFYEVRIAMLGDRFTAAIKWDEIAGWRREQCLRTGQRRRRRLEQQSSGRRRLVDYYACGSASWSSSNP